MPNRTNILEQLHSQIKADDHLIGVAAGSGMTARYAQKGGADFILALSSGYYRQRGVSSLVGYLPVANSNHIVMDFASKEILPAMEIPTIFGLSASDPTIELDSYIREIKAKGFAGITNYPTVGLLDGHFREALHEQGITYQSEINAIKIARQHDLFTIAFVFNEIEAREMIQAGADIICVHLGLTTGGALGGRQFKSLQYSKHLTTSISQICNEVNSDMIKMIYGGPVNKPVDVQFMYDGTDINGYIGGSAFERIPTEQMIVQVTHAFKTTDDTRYNKTIRAMSDDMNDQDDYIDFIKRHIHYHYNQELTLNDFADMVNLSRSYLSSLFKNKVGISFKDYLTNYRLNRAIEMMQKRSLPLNVIANMVGYTEYPQFSKMFKKQEGMSPTEYLKRNSNKKHLT